jgi:hypothetical protein
MNNRTAIFLGATIAIGQLGGVKRSAEAHQVQVSGDVGGTAHIEPNDNPRAGTPSLAWFAVTRPGGELIPLEACNCQLAVYARPVQPGDAPVQQPALKPVSAEGYAGVPGAEITFPQVGAYELVLQGQPKTPDQFQPFELRFEITVAAGQAAPSPIAPPSETPPEPAQPTAGLSWVILCAGLAIGIAGLLLWLGQSRKK